MSQTKKEIRLHGRGGQGAVSAADLLAVAAMIDGQYGSSFPMYGSERRGAPVDTEAPTVFYGEAMDKELPYPLFLSIGRIRPTE